jgi:hypothetical protein
MHNAGTESRVVVVRIILFLSEILSFELGQKVSYVDKYITLFYAFLQPNI